MPVLPRIINLTSAIIAGLTGANSLSSSYPAITKKDLDDNKIAGVAGGNSISTTYPVITKKDISADTIAGLVSTSGTPLSSTNKVVDNADTRNTNSRTPTAHAASHISGGDAIQNATNTQNGFITKEQVIELERVGGVITTNVAAGLAGTSGTAISAANKLIDNADPRVALLVKPANQAAATYTAVASAHSKMYLDYFPRIELAAGSYAASYFSLANIYSKITFVGDTRPLAGHTWKNGYPIHSSADGAGVGTTTISSTGNTVTLAGSTTNPKLNNVDNVWANGDKVVIAYNGGTQAEYTIDSINEGGDVITLTGAAPAVTEAGTTLTLVPNRTITEALDIQDGDITLQGFYMSGIANSSLKVSTPKGKLHLENFFVFNSATGIEVTDYGHLSCGKEVAVVKSSVGNILCSSLGQTLIDYIVCVGSPTGTTAGIFVYNARCVARYAFCSYHQQGAMTMNYGQLMAEYMYGVRCSEAGIKSARYGSFNASSGTFKNNKYGGYADTGWGIIVGGTYASNSSGNTAGSLILTS